jgi:hypothetical protein
MKNSQQSDVGSWSREKQDFGFSLSHTFVEFTFCVWFSKPQSFHIHLIHKRTSHFPYNYDYDMLYFFIFGSHLFLIILGGLFLWRAKTGSSNFLNPRCERCISGRQTKKRWKIKILTRALDVGCIIYIPLFNKLIPSGEGSVASMHELQMRVDARGDEGTFSTLK